MKSLHMCVIVLGLLASSTVAMSSDRLVMAEEQINDITVLDFRYDSVIVFTKNGEDEQFLLLTDIRRVVLADCPTFSSAEAYFADGRYLKALLEYRKCKDESDAEWFAPLLAARMQFCEDNMPPGTVLPPEEDTPQDDEDNAPVHVETPVLESISISEMALEDAVDALAMMADYSIEIDWDALEDLDISKDATVTLATEAITLEEALTVICQQLDERVVVTQWNTEDCTVKMTSSGAAAANTGLYYVIPLRGGVGEEIIVNTLKRSFNVAKAEGANVVVLHIESPGGYITTKDDILDLLREKKKEFRIVAYITEAHSAAAMIALLCDEIIMAPGAAMGSCVPYTRRLDGTPEMVSAKFLAAELAKIRATAEEGGHDPLLAEAMINYEMLLCYNEPDEEGDEIEIIEGRGDKVIKGTHEILNLSAKEAVKYGLSLGVADDVESMSGYLGLDGWEEVSRRGYGIQEDWEEEYEALMKDLDDTFDDYDDKWDDLISAARRGRKSRAFKLINELQQQILGMKNRLSKYEDDLPWLDGYEDYFEDWLDDLKDIEEDIESW